MRGALGMSTLLASSLILILRSCSCAATCVSILASLSHSMPVLLLRRCVSPHTLPADEEEGLVVVVVVVVVMCVFVFVVLLLLLEGDPPCLERRCNSPVR